LVARLWLLALLILPVSVCAKEPPVVPNSCLDCHVVHYTELGSCGDCHAGNPATRRVDIAHTGLIAARFSAFTLAENPVARQGEQRLKDYACRRCHVSDRKGNRLAIDLDVAPRYSTPQELMESIKTPVLFMPQFHFSEAQRVELVNAILAGAQRTGSTAGEQPSVIHFEGEKALLQVEFEKQCGLCHRALTDRLGGLGSGLIGPNLSGLLTQFYLQNFGDDKKSWTVENLEKWLKNPRKIRPLAQMPPLALKKDELERLVGELQPVLLPNTPLP